MNWRGRVLLCSFAVILSWGLVGEETTIGERLCRGMEESRKRSLVCPIQTPSILRNLQVARGEYAQWVSPQGVLHMKMVFWDASGEESVVFLKNEEGYFFASYGEWFPALDLLPLWYYQGIWLPLPEYELTLTTFQEQEVPGGKALWEIRGDVTRDVNALQGHPYPLWGKGDSRDVESSYYDFRPFLRKFILDAQKNFVSERVESDLKGRILFQRRIQNPDFQRTLGPGDFQHGELQATDKFFLMKDVLWKINQIRMERKKIQREERKASQNMAWRRRLFSRKTLAWGTALLALVFLGSAAVLRRWNAE